MRRANSRSRVGSNRTAKLRTFHSNKSTLRSPGGLKRKRSHVRSIEETTPVLELPVRVVSPLEYSSFIHNMRDAARISGSSKLLRDKMVLNKLPELRIIQQAIFPHLDVLSLDEQGSHVVSQLFCEIVNRGEREMFDELSNGLFTAFHSRKEPSNMFDSSLLAMEHVELNQNANDQEAMLRDVERWETAPYIFVPSNLVSLALHSNGTRVMASFLRMNSPSHQTFLKQLGECVETFLEHRNGPSILTAAIELDKDFCQVVSAKLKGQFWSMLGNPKHECISRVLSKNNPALLCTLIESSSLDDLRFRFTLRSTAKQMVSLLQYVAPCEYFRKEKHSALSRLIDALETSLPRLAVDQTGNFLVQSLVKVTQPLNPQIQSFDDLLERLLTGLTREGSLVSLSSDMIGVHVIAAFAAAGGFALESILKELRGNTQNIVELVVNQHTSLVLRRLLDVCADSSHGSKDLAQSLLDDLMNKVEKTGSNIFVDIASDPYGNLFVQKLLKHLPKVVTEDLVHQYFYPRAKALAQHPFAAHVLAKIIQLLPQESPVLKELVSTLRPDLLSLSRHVKGRLVAAALAKLSPEIQSDLIGGEDSKLSELCCARGAHHVVAEAYATARRQQREKAADWMVQHLKELANEQHASITIQKVLVIEQGTSGEHVLFNKLCQALGTRKHPTELRKVVETTRNGKHILQHLPFA